MYNFKINIDSKTVGYSPFTMLGIVIFIGILVGGWILSGRYVSELIRDNYWYVFAAVVVFEIVALNFVFPDEKIELRINRKKEFEFRYTFEKEVKEIRKIKKISYWWNHDYKESIKSDDAFDTPNSGSNGGLGGASVASGVRLYLELKDESDEIILLYEVEGNWASTPHWKYRLTTDREFEHKYKCFKLKKLVKELEERGLMEKINHPS